MLNRGEGFLEGSFATSRLEGDLYLRSMFGIVETKTILINNVM